RVLDFLVGESVFHQLVKLIGDGVVNFLHVKRIADGEYREDGNFVDGLGVQVGARAVGEAVLATDSVRDSGGEGGAAKDIVPHLQSRIVRVGVAQWQGMSGDKDRIGLVGSQNYLGPGLVLLVALSNALVRHRTLPVGKDLGQ